MVLMGKISSAAAFALLFLLLSGCVDIQVRQYFYPNGRSHVVQAIEISGLLGVLNSSSLEWNNQSGYGAWDELANISCSSAGMAEQGATCHRNGNWLMIDQERVSDEDYIFKSYSQFPYVIYDVTILRPPMIPAAAIGASKLLPNISSTYFTNSSPDAVNSFRGAGVLYSYAAVMPGEIFNATDGTVNGSEVQFDVLSQELSHKPVVIKSREYDWGQISIAVIFGLDIFLFFDVAIIMGINYAKKHKSEIERMREEAKERAAEARAAQRRQKLKGFEVYSYEGGDSIFKAGEDGKGKKGGSKEKPGEGKESKNEDGS